MTQRPYKSPIRKRQATETRNSIMLAAEKLFMEQGYEPTTIGVVASEAGVSPQTVYAVFGSKKGLLKALFERHVQAETVLEPCRLAMLTQDPREALGYIAGIACHIFRSTGHLYEMQRGSSATSAELRQLMQEQQQSRRSMQEEFIRHLYDNGHLRADFDYETALDTFWCLLNHELYRLLVGSQSWDEERFRLWFGDLLSRMLLR